MGPMARNEYVAVMRQRYTKADTRAKKTQILNEICATLELNRKYAIRLLGRTARHSKKLRRKKRGRKAVYADKQLAVPLKRIWLDANLPCSKRLAAILPLWLPGYEEVKGELPSEVKDRLNAISPATIDRLLKHTRLRYAGRGRTTTKPGGLLRSQIQIKTGQWKENRPGYIEADTVAHCGSSTSGTYALTLDCVDVATGWSEQRAVWGKQDVGIVKQVRGIERDLPFDLLGFDSDNGSEFINERLFQHFLSRKRPVLFTRSRAYQKNDNAHVEQKNWTHVRQWIGYHRLDRPEFVELLNQLYTTEWRLFHNLYCPSVKLISKTRVGSKTTKKYDRPKTPYQRVLESEHVSDYKKRRLTEIYENTNPFILRKYIETKLKRIFRLCAQPPLPEPSE